MPNHANFLHLSMSMIVPFFFRNCWNIFGKGPKRDWDPVALFRTMLKKKRFPRGQDSKSAQQTVSVWSTLCISSWSSIQNYKFKAQCGTSATRWFVSSLQLDQPSLGMMSKEYFLDESESKYKDAYLKYMISIAELMGANHSHAVREMTEVLDFEVKLANVSTRRCVTS